jgi:hypothetical protein
MGRPFQNARVTLDGTDFAIQEPSPFNPGWYSHKFKGPGLRYELGVAIATGWIVWINGPFPCGSWPDLKIARHGIQLYMDPGEKYIADGGYRDGQQFGRTPTGLNNEQQRLEGILRARHETVNGRFKCWAALNGTFRHDVHLHKKVFFSIANIVQIVIEEESPPFQVSY